MISIHLVTWMIGWHMQVESSLSLSAQDERQYETAEELQVLGTTCCGGSLPSLRGQRGSP